MRLGVLRKASLINKGGLPSRECTKPGRLRSTNRGASTSSDYRKEVDRVLELADRAAVRWELTWTDFLPPPVVGDAMAALAGRSDVQALPWGGYAQAERCRLALGREELMASARNDPEGAGGVAAIQVRGNFMFDAAKHPDFLGAVLGTGVQRERVGDILVQVRTVPVETSRIPLSQLSVPLPRTDELSSTEASLRVDALASAGFRMSRSKMADMVKAGDVRVNWKTVTKASVELKAGDVISVSGKGRLEIKSVQTTKKERFAVVMTRFV
ncbi:hypothetical protein QJQ45_003821 [Haematococcus lacustris]|nr:hypothetical protein QJQ45_003821 [Haematococcus lacustris]